MVKFIVLGFIAAEVALMAWFASAFGVGALLIGLAACFFIGILVMRLAGAQAFRALVDGTARDQAFGVTGPEGDEQVVLGAGADQAGMERAAKDVGDSSLLFLAGILIAVPGILSTLLGLVLTLPPVRSAMTRRIGTRMRNNAQVQVVTVEEWGTTTWQSDAPAPEQPRIIRGEILPPQG